MKLVEILAKEWGVWPARQGVEQTSLGDIFCSTNGRKAMFGTCAIASDQPDAIVTREMWEAERLSQNEPQPDWSKAPEWADRHGFVGPDRLEIWLNGSQYSYCDSDDGRTFDFGHSGLQRRRDSVIGETPRPTTPQWRGPEDGLPPVGMICENRDGATGKWSQVKIVAHHIDPGWAIFTETLSGGGLLYYGQAQDFRPNRAPRDKWIEAVRKHVDFSVADDETLGEMFDAGLAKLPEDGE